MSAVMPDHDPAFAMARSPASLLGQSTYERLRSMILSGMLPIGSSLNEKRLAERLGVSRTPVREAMTRLMSEGLITREAGGTPTVRRITIHEIVEILHMRRLLEVEAAGMAATRGGSGELAALRDRFVAFRDGPPPAVEDHVGADDRLHSLLAEMAGSRLLASLISDLRLKTRIFDTRLVPERLRPGAVEHLAIIDAVLEGNVPAAEEAMRTHIGNVRASVLSHLDALFR